MGTKQSSDIAQEVIENLFLGRDNVKIYIGNIGWFYQTLQIIFKPLTKS